jgi:O-methyltransferase involved in polyketide biosynthesis
MFNSKISKTALWLPGLRAIEGIPHAKEIHQRLATEAGESIDPTSAVGADPILNTALMGRYRKMSSMVNASGLRNFIEFAAGLSPRGISMTENNPRVQYIDSDLPDVINLREKVMPGMGGKGYGMLGGDAFDRETFERALRMLERAPSFDGRVGVVTEGLLRYHPPAMQDKLGANLDWLGSQVDSLTWWTDCVAKADTSKAPGCAAYNKTAGIVDDYCFKNDVELLEFMTKHGFRYNVADWSSTSEELVHAKKHGYDEKKIQEIIKLHKGTLIATATSNRGRGQGEE